MTTTDPIDWTSAAALIGMALVVVVWCSVCTLLVWAARREADEIRSQRDHVAMRADRAIRHAEVLEAARKQDLDAYNRRVDRWRIGFHELYSHCLERGLLDAWKRDLPQDTDFSDLSDTIPGATSADATS